MITFPGEVSPSVWLRGVCKTYSFMKQKYFAPIEMLYNTLIEFTKIFIKRME